MNEQTQTQTPTEEQSGQPVVGQPVSVTQTVEVVSRKTNNTQRNNYKDVSLENVVSQAKRILKLKQSELTTKIQAKGQELGLTVSITRGRLSNMCNGNCNLTESVETACKEILKESGWNVKEKEWKVPQKEATV